MLCNKKIKSNFSADMWGVSFLKWSHVSNLLPSSEGWFMSNSWYNWNVSCNLQFKLIVQQKRAGLLEMFVPQQLHSVLVVPWCKSVFSLRCQIFFLLLLCWVMADSAAEMLRSHVFLLYMWRDWEGRRVGNSMLHEGLSLLSNLTQEDVNAVINGLREQKKGRTLVRSLIFINH